jgi:hypothetical protein
MFKRPDRCARVENSRLTRIFQTLRALAHFCRDACGLAASSAVVGFQPASPSFIQCYDNRDRDFVRVDGARDRDAADAASRGKQCVPARLGQTALTLTRRRRARRASSLPGGPFL